MQALLPLHILAGGVAIVLGAIALSARKGRTLHRKSGILFVTAMLVMGISGSLLALRHGLNANAIGGIVSAYFVVTALTTVRPPRMGARGLALAGMIAIFGVGLLNLALGVAAIGSPDGMMDGVPPPAFFFLAIVGLLGGAGDLRVMRTGPLRGRPRLARHLWRMCFAFFIAVASFFSIRARVARILPEPFLGPTLRTVPILLVLATMVYWLLRMRVGRTPRSVTAFTQESPLAPGSSG